jgi:hypothetical protein
MMEKVWFHWFSRARSMAAFRDNDFLPNKKGNVDGSPSIPSYCFLEIFCLTKMDGLQIGLE